VKNNQSDNQIQNISLCNIMCFSQIRCTIWGLGQKPQKLESFREFWFKSNLTFYRAVHYSAKRGLAIACRPSVHLSVTLVDQDHVRWKSWKL